MLNAVQENSPLNVVQVLEKVIVSILFSKILSALFLRPHSETFKAETTELVHEQPNHPKCSRTMWVLDLFGR